MSGAASDQKHIVIVGGGIIGCTTAYFLTRHPAYDRAKHRITLLEATAIASGASGKAGGLLALWAYPSSLVPLSYKLHQQLADEHNGAERWGYRAVHCGQVDCDGRHLPVASSPTSNDPNNPQSVDGKDNPMDGENSSTSPSVDNNSNNNVSLQKRSKHALGKLRAAGVPTDLDWVSAECLRAYDAMGDPSTTAQVHPLHFTKAMAELASERGAEIRVGAAVTGLVFSDDGQRVDGVKVKDSGAGKTADAQVGAGAGEEQGEETTLAATDVVLAAGPWTRSVYPDAPINALRAHSVTIRPSRPVSAYALFTQIKLPAGFGSAAAASNGNGRERKGGRGGHGGQVVAPEIYARPKNEVYACGEGDHMVPLPPASDLVEVDETRCQDIVDFVASISDELRDGEVTARQACYLPSVSGSSAPLVGHTGVKGLIMAAGHTCWGIQNGPGTGKLVSEFVFDGKAKSANVKGLAPQNYL